MGRRLEKWKKALNSEAQKKAFDNQKKEMARKESKHTKELVYIEEAIKEIADGQQIIHLPYYMIFGKEIYSKSLKNTETTLFNEACILKQKWRTRGLDEDILRNIFDLFLINYGECPDEIEYLPIDCRLFWPHSHASIPAGWSRDTNYDDKFPQGHNGAGLPGATGGAVNHNHNVNTHSHTTPSHNHTLQVTGTPMNIQRAQTGVGTPTAYATNNHLHNDAQTNSSSPTSSSDASTILQNSAEPQNRGNILIKPDDAEKLIPHNSVVLHNSTTIPGGFNITNGAGGTVDLDQRYTKMPVALGNGGAASGNLTHNHLTNGNHVHTITHSHTDSNFGNPTLTIGRVAGIIAKGTTGIGSHHQATNIQNRNDNLIGNTENFDAKSNDPPYIKLLGLQNTSGSDQAAVSEMILPFVGNTAAVPGGWTLCDGTGAPDVRDKQVKITAFAAQIGATGGSATHWHTGLGHIHAGINHSHAYTMTTQGYTGTGIATWIAHDSHLHWAHALLVANMTINNSFSTTQTADGRLPYKTIHYIKKV